MNNLNRPFTRFIIRWFACSLGLWIAANFLSSSISYGSNWAVIIISGLILAIINIALKPFLIILSLPALIFSLGLFMLVINGLTVYLASVLYHPLHITNFWAAIFAGIVIGLVNYLVTTILGDFKK
jgi:putative membrane protein